MADLETINLASVGQIRATGDVVGEMPQRATITPLIQTTKSAGVLGLEALTPPIEPRRLLKSFTPGNEPLTLAARLTGNVKSAYPEGAPPVDEESEAENKLEAEAVLPAHLAESAGPINVVLVADSDLLQDMFWSREENLFGQRITRRLADNADFVMASIDNLAGGRALAGVRARREIARPFTVVDEMAARAEREFLTQQQMLEERLTQTQQRIDELEARLDQIDVELELRLATRDDNGDLRATRCDLNIENLRGVLAQPRQRLLDHTRGELSKLGILLRKLAFIRAIMSTLLTARIKTITILGLRAEIAQVVIASTVHHATPCRVGASSMRQAHGQHQPFRGERSRIQAFVCGGGTGEAKKQPRRGDSRSGSVKPDHP
jgi:hypothetical protein